jgi:hypothetical protein
LLVDYGAVGPLRCGDIVDFAAKAGRIETALGVGFGQADEMGHDVGGFAAALGDENVDAGSGGSGSGTRSLQHNFVGGPLGHGDGGDFSHLQAGAEEFDAGGAEGIAFEEGNLELTLAEAEDDVGLLRFFHEQAGGWSLADDDVDGEFAIDAIGDTKIQATGAEQAGGFGDIFADEVGHGDFAAVNGDAHGGDGGEESRGSEDENEQSHLTELLEATTEIERRRRRWSVESVVQGVRHRCKLKS